MASPNKRRQKKRKATERMEARLRRPESVVEDTRNLLLIGGTIGSMKGPMEREGRLWRAVALRCEDGPRRITWPWVNVYDSFGEFIAEQARGEPVSLSGYIRRLREPHPVTHQMWELYVNRLLRAGTTNPNGGYHACNEIKARGRIAYRRSRFVGEHRNLACEFGLECDGPGHGSNLVEMIAFYKPESDITGLIERWPPRRELEVAARVKTYGEDYTRTSIVATEIRLGLDEEVPR
jgi:hypothetical protein